MSTSLNIPTFNGGLSGGYYVFFLGQYLSTLDQMLAKIYHPETRDPKLYNKVFIYHHYAVPGNPQWWRADGTPYPKEQVPKAYLGMCLLVT